MKEKTATFIGHRQCTGLNTENLRNEIEGLVQKGVCNFLNGGMGSFDWTCARIVHEMREKYPQIRSYLVIPYLLFESLSPSILMRSFTQRVSKNTITKLPLSNGINILWSNPLMHCVLLPTIGEARQKLISVL